MLWSFLDTILYISITNNQHKIHHTKPGFTLKSSAMKLFWEILHEVFSSRIFLEYRLLSFWQARKSVTQLLSVRLSGCEFQTFCWQFDAGFHWCGLTRITLLSISSSCPLGIVLIIRVTAVSVCHCSPDIWRLIPCLCLQDLRARQSSLGMAAGKDRLQVYFQQKMRRVWLCAVEFTRPGEIHRMHLYLFHNKIIIER